MKKIITYICLALLPCYLSACGDHLSFSSSGLPDDGTKDNGTYTDNHVAIKALVYDAGTDNHIYYRIPAMTVTTKGTILAFCEARNTEADFYKGHESLFPVTPCASGSKDTGDIDLVVKRSTDGGSTWSKMITIVDDKLNTCGNPSPVVIKDTGRIIVFWCWSEWPYTLSSNLVSSISDGHYRRVMYCYSDDDGETWSTPKDMTSTLKQSDWTWYATGPCHAIVKQLAPNKSRIIIPANHRDATNTNNYSHDIYSDDNGNTWKLGGSTQLGGNESCIVELADGSIMTNMRIADTNVEGGCRAYSISKDGGVTWGSFNRIPSLIDPGCQGAIVNYNTDGTPSETLLLSNDFNAKTRSNISISKSTNSGNTWTTPCTVWSGRGAYSDIAVLSDGSVCVLYESGYGKYGTANPNEQINFYRIPPSLLKTTLGITK
jgi:sialidase-1